MDVIDSERERISRDLHDGIVQELVAVIRQNELCMRHIETDPTRAKLELQDINNLVRGMITELRDIIYGFQSFTPDRERLINIIKKTERFCGIRIILEDNFSYKPKYYETETVLIRIIQEALVNVHKHAHAKIVYVKCSDEGIQVIDDGDGFSVDSIKIDNFGLKIMKDRAESIGMKFEVISKPEYGTKVIVRMEDEQDDQSVGS